MRVADNPKGPETSYDPDGTKCAEKSDYEAVRFFATIHTVRDSGQQRA
jgi:hypothetical protein